MIFLGGWGGTRLGQCVSRGGAAHPPAGRSGAARPGKDPALNACAPCPISGTGVRLTAAAEANMASSHSAQSIPCGDVAINEDVATNTEVR